MEKASALQAVQELTDLGSVVETYDVKNAVRSKGKLDIHLQFFDEKLEIVAVKKDEEKLMLFDILSLHRYIPVFRTVTVLLLSNGIIDCLQGP